MVIPEIDNGAFPVLVRLTTWAALVVPTVCVEKLKLPGEIETAGCEEKPLPLRLTLLRFWALPSDPVTVSAPNREPTAVGVNVTLNTQEVPPLTPLAEQLLT